LKQRRVRYTETAQEHVWREERWWLENRNHPEVFADEFERALEILSVLLPGAGALYHDSGAHGLRRIYLAKVACHIYYTFDDDEIIVRAFWGARRGRGPLL
jgi:hypothetical protein